MIVFDLDGVLVDACEWHRIALNNALKKVCDYEISLEDHYEIFNGIPTKVKLQTLTDMQIVKKEDHKKIYDIKQKETIKLIKKKAKNRPEKIKMINDLKEKGLIVACYTNSIRETAELMLEKTGIIDLFDKIVTNQDVTKSKPDPEGYISLMDHFEVSAKDTLILEDSPKGFAAARASKARVIRVDNPDSVDKDLFRGLL
jgi:HAD superfamily hydrolase (TIGR01509 family)